MANHHLSQELSLACGFWFLFHPRESYLGSFSSRPHPLSMGTGRGPAPRWPCPPHPPPPAPIKNPILTPPSFPRPNRISRSRFPKPLPPPDCLSVSLVPPPPSLAVTALPHTTTTLLPAYFASVPSSAGCISNWRYPAAPCTGPAFPPPNPSSPSRVSQLLRGRPASTLRSDPVCLTSPVLLTSFLAFRFPPDIPVGAILTLGRHGNRSLIGRLSFCLFNAAHVGPGSSSAQVSPAYVTEQGPVGLVGTQAFLWPPCLVFREKCFSLHELP